MDETGQPGGPRPGEDDEARAPRTDRSWSRSSWQSADSAWSPSGAATDPGRTGQTWREPTPPRLTDGWVGYADRGDVLSVSSAAAVGQPRYSNGVRHVGQVTGAQQIIGLTGEHRYAESSDQTPVARHHRSPQEKPAAAEEDQSAAYDGEPADPGPRPVSPAPLTASPADPSRDEPPTERERPAWAGSSPLALPGYPSRKRERTDDERTQLPSGRDQTGTDAAAGQPATGGDGLPGPRRAEGHDVPSPRRAEGDDLPGRRVVGRGVPSWARPWPTGGGSPAPQDPPAETAAEALPQRVPAAPDVPAVPEPPGTETSAEAPALARIATHLRRDEPSAPPHERPDGFDVEAIVAAVREVPGVRDASVRTTPAGAHSLRLDLADGADPAEVSRRVARLLQERMGLAAAPQNLPEQVTGQSVGAPARQPEPVTPRRRRRGARGADPAGRRGGTTRPTDQPPAPPTPGGPDGDGHDPIGLAATAEGGASRPLLPGSRPGRRVVVEHVQVSTSGMEATVEVRLAAGELRGTGLATGPAVDGYVLRLCAASAASAIDELLRGSGRDPGSGRCFVEHAAVVPAGSCEAAVVVVLLVCDGWVEQLSGSAIVAGDPRQAVVRATLAAVNRRLTALLSGPSNHDR